MSRQSARWPAIVHRWTQDLPQHFTGYGLTDATREMLAERERKRAEDEMRRAQQPETASDE